MTAMAWADVRVELTRRQLLRRVEIMGLNLRLSGAVDIGSFTRLTDFVMSLPGSLRLEDATVLNRRGTPTTDVLPELRLYAEQLVLIAETEAPPSEPPAVPDVFVSKRQEAVTLLTTAHVVRGTISLYPGASASAYLLSPEPAFMPMQDVTVRWLADRRLRRRFGFALVNRRHLVGVAVDGDASS
jgi:hypothetical protein